MNRKVGNKKKQGTTSRQLLKLIHITKVVLLFSISNFFTNKIPREGNWVSFSCSNSALGNARSIEIVPRGGPPFWGCMLMNSRGGPPFWGFMLMNSRGGPPSG